MDDYRDRRQPVDTAPACLPDQPLDLLTDLQITCLCRTPADPSFLSSVLTREWDKVGGAKRFRPCPTTESLAAQSRRSAGVRRTLQDPLGVTRRVPRTSVTLRVTLKSTFQIPRRRFETG